MKGLHTREQCYADFMLQREAYGRKKPAYDFVRCFLNWCGRTYPDEVYLTQEMVDAWCTKRETEKVSSHGNRTAAINHFLTFVNERGGGPFIPAEYSCGDPSPEPVLATKGEMVNFFKAVDELSTGEEYGNMNYAVTLYVRAIEAPVFFRMLYSIGIRVNEMRWLHREDVDLDSGIVYIRRAKGYNERIVALHPTMTELLRKYVRLIRKGVLIQTSSFPMLTARNTTPPG